MLTREKGNFRGARLHPSHGLPPSARPRCRKI
jgi:hypothetical protein